MKKHIITLAIALAVTAVPAEARDISTGTIMVTGDSSMDVTSSESSALGSTTKIDTFRFNITSAYFIAPNLGAGLQISHSTSEVDSGGSVMKSSMSAIGPVIGYNISLNQDTSIILHGAIFLVDREYDNGAGSTDVDGSGYSIGASFNYFVNDYVATSVGLNMVDTDYDYSSGRTDFSAENKYTAANVGISLFF